MTWGQNSDLMIWFVDGSLMVCTLLPFNKQGAIQIVSFLDHLDTKLSDIASSLSDCFGLALSGASLAGEPCLFQGTSGGSHLLTARIVVRATASATVGMVSRGVRQLKRLAF
jgi:hypothetical protein